MTTVTITETEVVVTATESAVALTVAPSVVALTVAPGVTDHGALTGLSDDDHPQYLTAVEGNAAYSATGHTHSFASLTSIPTTLTGYGITDAVPSSRTLTINGTALDLSADRSWTIAAGGTVAGTGTPGRIPQWATGGANIEDSTLAKTGAGVLTFAASGAFTATIPATLTVAGLGIANVFTMPQTIQGTADTEQLIVKAFSAQTLANPLIQLQSSAGAAWMNITTDRASNVFIGIQAGDNTNAANNVAIGQNALHTNTSGANNFALGSNALTNVSNSDANVAIGSNALQSGTTLASNAAIGTDTGSSLNGSDNIMIGRYSMQLAAGTVNQNVMIGNFTGRNLATGNSGNVFIGYLAGSAAGHQGSNQLIVENSASLRPLIKGDFSADTLTFYATDAATNAVRTQITRDYSSSGTPAVGFGVRDRVLLRSSTTDSQLASATDTLWATATHASFKARVLHQVGDAGGLRTYLTGEASGTAAMVGLYGGSAVLQKAAITAPTGGATIDAEARTAIGLVLTALGAGAGGIGITA